MDCKSEILKLLERGCMLFSVQIYGKMVVLMSITNELFLKKLIEDSLIEWHPHANGGFVAKSNGVFLYLSGGTQTSRGCLVLTEGFDRHEIEEPGGPIWKDPPEARILLSKLAEKAGEQCIKRQQDEKYRGRIRERLLRRAAGWDGVL
ncbi:MAG: hypothetical protein A2831_00330 [Candidatus Yanofskybacteria bacterium RIFCSPHIGHO2_01_FULL_44_17]|uniref:Uncharacterized protein n=1 Tax=Candidatus Yanofskybacteria bacterium RIFCSPHIGHO2_01_FULL_44_17 TaxID=1802668 RepID=A0A1F8EXQ7_9BACT|nr:MAG: hypothetical protein A2831_00330 [Candidatus Yanofskybacteria bacterium RIFCSPHIGHO2_01_FULL_44_17]